MTSSSSTAETGGATSSTAAAPQPPPRRGVAVPTLVWGLFVTLVGAGFLARLLGAEFDDELALIVLLAAAGVALVGVSVATAVRRR